MIESEDTTDCKNEFYWVKIAIYGTLAFSFFVVWIRFIIVLLRERNHIWRKYKAWFLYLIIGIESSLAIKIILGSYSSIIYQRVVEFNMAYETITTLLYAWSELGLMLLWLVIDKPYEFYSLLNEDKWYGQVSIYQTSERDCLCIRKKRGGKDRLGRQVSIDDLGHLQSKSN
jgi:hypothetical protein